MTPVVLAIAGTDPTGGAGLRVDLETITSEGGRAAFAVTEVFAQNARRVVGRAGLPADVVRAQIDAVFEEHAPAAVKIGALGSGPTVGAVAAALDRPGAPPVVCDPVIESSSGGALLDEAGVDALLRTIVPRAALLTPNAGEAGRLTGETVHDPATAERAGLLLREHGANAVLVTGGHFETGQGIDVLVDASGTRMLPGEWLRGDAIRGTGCALSASIATALARGASLSDAIDRGRRFVREAIRLALAAPAPARPGGRPGAGPRRLEPHRVVLSRLEVP